MNTRRETESGEHGNNLPDNSLGWHSWKSEQNKYGSVAKRGTYTCYHDSSRITENKHFRKLEINLVNMNWWPGIVVPKWIIAIRKIWEWIWCVHLTISDGSDKKIFLNKSAKF